MIDNMGYSPRQLIGKVQRLMIPSEELKECNIYKVVGWQW